MLYSQKPANDGGYITIHPIEIVMKKGMIQKTAEYMKLDYNGEFEFELKESDDCLTFENEEELSKFIDDLNKNSSELYGAVDFDRLFYYEKMTLFQHYNLFKTYYYLLLMYRGEKDILEKLHKTKKQILKVIYNTVEIMKKDFERDLGKEYIEEEFKDINLTVKIIYGRIIKFIPYINDSFRSMSDIFVITRKSEEHLFSKNYDYILDVYNGNSASMMLELLRSK